MCTRWGIAHVAFCVLLYYTYIYIYVRVSKLHVIYKNVRIAASIAGVDIVDQNFLIRSNFIRARATLDARRVTS